MKNNIQSELIVSSILILLLIVFVNPMDFFMPPPFLTMLVVIFIVLFSVFAALVWKEKTNDEREGFLRMFAGRIAYLLGAGVLVVGIIIQSFAHTLDPWLVYALLAMIVGKIIGFVYGQKKY